MFENFPYTDMHQLNLDWIIKIAKDFLDQYTHIQEVIDTGLNDLDEKATNLENLLQQWYDTHSEDIANQLAAALDDLNTWYTTHQNYLDQTLANNLATFSQQAAQRAQETIATIPADYTTLSDGVREISSALSANGENIVNIKTWQNLSYNVFEPYWGAGNRVSNAGDEYDLWFYDSIIVNLIDTTTTHAVRVDIFNADKSVGESVTLSTQNPSYSVPMDRNYKYLRVLVLGSTDISPTIVTGLFSIIATGMNKKVNNNFDFINAINNLLNTHYISWLQKTGTTHSSNADRLSVNITQGETFKMFLGTSDNSRVTGVLAGFGGIESGKIYDFTADTNLDSVGVYLDRTSTTCIVTLYIIQNGILDIDKVVPDYWKTEIDSKLQNVALLQNYVTGVTFGFITDIHWGSNWKRSPELIEYITKNSPVNVWINGGDTASGDGGNGEQQMQWLFEAMGRYYHSCRRFYSINGNHDNNHNDGIGTTLSDATLHNLIMPHYNGVTFGGPTYYWFDYSGTRFVCLDNGTTWQSNPTQVAWAKNVIEASPLPVIIVMHIVYTFPDDPNPCGFFTELKDAIGVNSNVKLIIAGHLHDDRSFITDTGIPVVILNTDSILGDDGTIRNRNTLTEQCLSIVTADYTNKKITITRIGAVKTGFVVNY